jgi:RimJ/RimL family protein N-acetyltransferase
VTVLVTPRLSIRPFGLDDVDDLLAMDGDDRVMRYIGTGMTGRTREQCAAAVERIAEKAALRPDYGLLHASRRDNGEFVGGCGLFPLEGTAEIEIAYRLPFAQWGHGYATEMARALVDHGFRALGLSRIVGLTFPENVPSQRVLEKIGMRTEPDAVHYGHLMRIYSATREAWK